MNALSPPRVADYLLPQSSRARFPRDLLVDLRALDADRCILWSWPCRRWRGADVVVALELPAEGWPPRSWRGFVEEADIERLRSAFGGRAAEAEVAAGGEDLDDLLRRSRSGLVISVWPPGP